MIALIFIFIFGVASEMTIAPPAGHILEPTQITLSDISSPSDTADEVTNIELRDDKSLSPEMKGAMSEIRCYCNLPECVATSYMCKSKIPGCFSDLQDSLSFNEAIHGCMDFLPRGKEFMCQNRPGGAGLGVRHSLLLCCREDLCNHVDSVNRMSLNGSGIPVLGEDPSEEIPVQRPSYSSQEVWFKAATIAVPICGFLILLMLIVLAMKILRTDPQALPPKLWAKESTAGLLGGGLVGHNPGADTNCCATKKLPLLFQQNDCARPAPDPTQRGYVQEKNEANAKLNNPTDLIDLHKASLRAPCNLYQPLLPPNLPAVHGTNHSNIFGNQPSWPVKNS